MIRRWLSFLHIEQSPRRVELPGIVLQAGSASAAAGLRRLFPNQPQRGGQSGTRSGTDSLVYGAYRVKLSNAVELDVSRDRARAEAANGP